MTTPRSRDTAARVRLAALLGFALACAGCRTGWLSTAGDWSQYRAVKVEPTLELRLAAAKRYLDERPRGAFRGEVREWFDHAEEVFYRSKRPTRAGLNDYLAALPRGPHAEDVKARLAELETRKGELETIADAVRARIAGPTAKARAAVRKELGDWLARWLDPQVFRVPIARAKADLVIAWVLSLPRARCRALAPTKGSVDVGGPPEAPTGAIARCVKLLELGYEVDGAKDHEPRQATLEITEVEDASGTPLEVTVGGPDLFLRLEETVRIKPIAPDDAEARKAATARVVDLVRRAFLRGVSDDDDCAQNAEGPAALRLACNGVQVEVFPTATPGDDDRITIVPLGPAPRPEPPPIAKPREEKPTRVEPPPVEKPPVEKPPVEKPPVEKPREEKPRQEKPREEKPKPKKPPSDATPDDD